MNKSSVGKHTSEQRAHDNVAYALLDHAQVGLLALDGALNPILLNAAARQMLGLDASATPSVMGIDESRRLGAVERAQLVALARGELDGPLRIRTDDGLAMIVSRRLDAVGTVLLSLVSIGFAEIAPPNFDPVTGLADRQSFEDRLEQLCATPGSDVAVMVIDLDHFKPVNDALGHPAGDALLKLVAQRVRGTVRNADVVSRLRADEFAVAMQAVPDLPDIAARLLGVLSRPYLVERQPVVVGASIGIASAPQHGGDAISLIRAAGLALSQAKAEGRNAVRTFNAEMDQRARKRHVLANDLRRAIPLQQLELHFQPQICLQTRALTGFEALVRWRHPQLGMVGPDQFIPLAEETGVILPLGEWVLREACRQAAAWPDDISVAVNVSPQQLLDRDRLPRAIAESLASAGLPAERLEIEITESALLREADALDLLIRIRSMGVKISMDDFGTGYSSLSQLRRFPFNTLKIDRSFIRDLGVSEEAGGVVRAIAALGRSLSMTTVAEGVETIDQEAFCRTDGCTTMQGYLVSKPVPAGNVAELIKRLISTPTDQRIER